MFHFNKKLLGLAIGSTFLVIAQNSLAAGSSSATANYEITLGAACSITATGQVFPAQMAGAMADLINTAAGTVTVTCNPGISYDWGISSGSNWSVFWGGNRHMKSAATGQNIPYQLLYNGMTIGDDGLQWRDPGYLMTTPGLWSAQMIGPAMIGTGMPQAYNLTSNVNLGALGMPYTAGTYTDTVTVTVAF